VWRLTNREWETQTISHLLTDREKKIKFINEIILPGSLGERKTVKRRPDPQTKTTSFFKILSSIHEIKVTALLSWILLLRLRLSHPTRGTDFQRVEYFHESFQLIVLFLHQFYSHNELYKYSQNPNLE
jgi:hypothetical protein